MTTEMNDVTNHQPNRKSNDENIMAMLIYLLNDHIYYWSTDTWLLKKDESKLVDRAGKNYLNYTISYIILVYCFSRYHFNRRFPELLQILISLLL